MHVVYNPYLIFLSILVAIFASYVALNLAYSVTQAQGRGRAAWLVGGALAMGVGIWSMHFVGMLAFEMPGMDMAYDVPLMLLSVVVAVLGSALALYVVSRPRVATPSLGASGVAMAAAISGMHYIGMYSMRMAARIEWNLYIVLLSILIALVTSFAALAILKSLRKHPERIRMLVLASTLMGIAIAGMHYTGMFAATFIHDSAAQIKDSNLIVSSGVTIATITTTLLILGIALAGSVGQRLLAVHQKHNDAILGKSEEKYRLLVEAVKDYGIFMIDSRGFVTTWNSGAQKITGYSALEIIGRHVSVLYGHEDNASEIAGRELATARVSGHFEGEAIRLKKDGSKFWANIVTDPLFDKDGALTGYSKVIRDITQVRETNEELEKRVQERTFALQEREAQLRTITNAMPILIAQVDRFERFLFANDSFCTWFQRRHDELEHLTFRDVLGEDRYPGNQTFIERALKGETVSYERNSRSGSREASLRITYVPEFCRNRQVKGFIIVAADVSNYKRIEAELKSAKEEAEVANQTKSAFLANMSHEIRTPLGAVIGFSELLLNGELPASERLNTLEIIKRNGKLLSTIINDILDLSKVEAGKLEVERTDVYLSELLHELAAFLNLEAAGKGIQFTVSSEGVIPAVIKTDPVRLRQVLFNIVGNAIKFTDKGTVSLKAKLAPANSAKISFVIQDSGTGIAAEQAARLFSPFTQADVTTTRKFGGTGLGLVLSKKLANALGGDVVLAETFLGKGSTFVVTIDHGQSKEIFFKGSEQHRTPTKPVPLTSRSRNSELSRLKILVVDDSPDNLVLIQSILRLAGADVDIADSGREGIDKALTGEFNIVLMDLQMPEMDGYEATKELRIRGFNRPIIALTAHAMKEARTRCLESGFNEHLTKPIDRRSLIEMLSEFSA